MRLLAFALLVGPVGAFISYGPFRHSISGERLPLSYQRLENVCAAERQVLRMCDDGLRTMFSPPWACLKKCGACCYLAPEERILDQLSEQDHALYVSMAGEDGWCVHFDKDNHLCGQYDDRPSFCRIENLGSMYGIEDDEEVKPSSRESTLLSRSSKQLAPHTPCHGFAAGGFRCRLMP